MGEAMTTAKPTHALSGVVATASASVATASFTIVASGSFASLIFSGPLERFANQGVWVCLFSAFVVGLIVSLTSSYAVAIAIPQDRVAPILALMSANIVARSGAAPPAEICMAVVLAISVVSLITGTTLFLLGRLRLGNLIRYIPYPVIGGFLAGSGWLLVSGSLRVATGHALHSNNLEVLFGRAALTQLVVSAVFGVSLFLALRRFRLPFTAPLMLLISVGLFYLVIKAMGISLETVRSNGWLQNVVAGGDATHFSPLQNIRFTPWHLLVKEWSILVSIILTSIVSILLTASALEIASGEEIDLNRELGAAGIATFAAGLGGGMIGFQSLSMSRLALSIGARTRWVGIVSSIICGLALWFGSDIVSYVPRYVCAGLLFFLGLTFLWEWVYQARKTLNHLDYGVVLLILAVVGSVGYPEGIGVGIVAAVLMFLHNYSRVQVVTHTYSGADLRSNVERPVGELRFLREHGGAISVLRLQGFIFFGTANDLLHRVRNRAEDAALPRLKFVIFDFRRVSGLDSSAGFSLSKVGALARRLNFELILTDAAEPILRLFEKSGLIESGAGTIRIVPDLDSALEWCELHVLKDNAANNGSLKHLEEQLREAWPADVEPRRLLPYLERLDLPPNTYLIRQSDQSQSLYFIESGCVTAQLALNNGRQFRLRAMGPGTVVGEVGMFLGGLRSASVITEEACTAYQMSEQALARMNREQPDLSLAFHRYLICVLGERLNSNSRILRGVME
jgi:sulfate permease, SulP family